MLRPHSRDLVLDQLICNQLGLMPLQVREATEKLDVESSILMLLECRQEQQLYLL